MKEEERYNQVMILLWHTISKLHGCMDAAPFSIHVELFSCSDLSFNRLTGKIPDTFEEKGKERTKLDNM